MYDILMLNNISASGTDVLNKERYNLTTDSKEPTGILLRSFNMHDMELPESLLAVARAGAGVNNIPVSKCSEKGIVVFNTPGANANAVKEMVLAALFLSSRKIVDGINWAQTLKGQDAVESLVEKGKGQFGGNELLGKTIGVIGLGAIGVLVANICLKLGMKVIGYDPFISIDVAWKMSRNVRKANTLDELLSESDYITLHIPLFETTKHIINENIFKLMKDGVKILNFARGGLVDNEAIIKGLQTKKIACYVTDFPCEEIIGVENIITIPHLGASTYESEENCALMASDELRNYLEYGNIKNSVNFPNCELPMSTKKRICVINKNIPDVLGNITKILSSDSINIENMLNKSKDDYSYTIIDVNEYDLNKVQEDLMKIAGVIKVRII